MKTKLMVNIRLRLTISFLLGLLAFAFYFEFPAENSSPNPPQLVVNENLDDRFLLGAMNTISDHGNNYVHYDSLGFNLWHTYIESIVGADNRTYPLGIMYFSESDSLFSPVSAYADSFRIKISEVYQHSNSRMVLHRPKIEWLCYGQRSDYQCEAVSSSDPLWFYSFLSPGHIGIDTVDDGVYGYDGLMVRYCEVNANQTDGGAGWVVSKLKANSEQCRVISEVDNRWQGDSECEWLIKPRIRIDSTVADNPLNWNNPVCSLTVKNDNGFTIKNVILRVRHFLDDFGNYDGHYKEEFRYEAGDDTLTIQGAWGTSWIWSARGDRETGSGYNLADIQVYWYGQCDMWIDYVRVDNDVADELFKGDRDDWIKDEVEQIGLYKPAGATTPAGYKFYIEQTEFNNIPCMAYVNKKLKYYSSQYNGGADVIDLMPDWYLRYSAHMPWDDRTDVMNAEHIKRFWVDSLGLSAFFAECYPYNSTGEDYSTNNFAKIPNTLPNTNCGFLSECGIMADTLSPAAFDEWLQDNMDHEPYYFSSNAAMDLREYYWARGSFRFVMELGNEITRTRNIPFIHMPQAHSWYNEGIENHNEPTNEELDLQANLSVSYGAKGLLYFMYPSGGVPGERYYTKGIADNIEFGQGYILRQKNIYNQDKTKKQTFIDLRNRLTAWEPYIMSFDNSQINSYIFRLERSNLVNQTYFSDVVSYIRGTGLPSCQFDSPDTTDAPHPPDLRYECFEDRYLQVATFESRSDDNRYFMIVNRRCSPVKEGYEDGQRFIRVLFDHGSTDLPAFNNWNIIDIKTDSTISVIKINGVNPYADLGWFAPGEGRLYKMVSTVKSGGTLIADEHISGQSFTCEDTVISNGHNITIDEGSVISFTDSATIIMNGGTFSSGVHGTGSSELLTYKGEGSGKWNGLRFNGTDVNIYNSKFQDIASPCVNYAISMVDCQFADIRTNQFVLNTDTAGAIQSVYIEDPFGSPAYTGLHINYNSITMANSRG